MISIFRPKWQQAFYFDNGDIFEKFVEPLMQWVIKKSVQHRYSAVGSFLPSSIGTSYIYLHLYHSAQTIIHSFHSSTCRKQLISYLDDLELLTQKLPVLWTVGSLSDFFGEKLGSTDTVMLIVKLLDVKHLKSKMPTAPCVPRRSPIQVLTGLNAA